MVPVRDRRTGFSRRRQNAVFAGFVLTVAGALLGAALLVISRFDPPLFVAARMSVASVTTPVSSVLGQVAEGIGAIPDAIGEWLFVHRENRALRAESQRNHALLMRARTIAYDNRRLRVLLHLRDLSPQPVATARLVSSTASSGRRFAMLDAGRWQGVQVGMPVRGPEGLVGRVIETGPAVARILLLSDAESLVPVRRTRDGLPAIAAGRGDGALEIRSVTTNVRFGPGDVFVTTGTGGIYAPGTPVAHVVRTGVDVAVAQVFAAPDSLDFALVERPFLALPPPRVEHRP